MKTRLLPWLLAAWAVASVGCGDDPSPTLTPDSAIPDAPPGDSGEDASKMDLPPTDNGPEACPTGQSRCGTDCVDTQTNNSHCGRCDNACGAGQRCAAGVCGASMMCAGSDTLCSGVCVDTSSSALHCGGCGNVCPSGQACRGGTCMAPMTCPKGQTDCGGTCVDTNTDAMSCGRCGMACAAGQSCVAGACTAGMMCPTGQTSCSGVCADTSTDGMNCGRCGNACPTGQRCAMGSCSASMCPTGQTDCGGSCVDATSSAMHCGACGRACAAGQTCAAGTCTGTMTCAPTETRCGEACVNTMTDPMNCGRCARACASGETCTGGACRAGMEMCPAGQTRCGAACVSTDTDAMNCGMCGRACPAGQTCAGGSCGCALGSTLCGAACVDTQTSNANCGMCGDACPTGQSCAAGRCGCPSGRTACGAACVDTATDATHCGMCGNACPAGQTCAMGRCGCAAGSALCAGVCVNTQTSNANCGMCGNVCTMGQTCAMGRCGCAAPNTMCGTRCTNTMTDATNCGRCGNACPQMQTCSGGTCRSVLGPPNDERSGATRIDLARPAQDLMTDTALARNDTRGGCSCTAGNDVFYIFTLTQPEIVYADTIGATWDTSLFLQTSTGANVTDAGTVGGAACNDDDGFCRTGSQSQIVARLAAGTYYLVLSGCRSGAATIHFQHLPAGNGASARIAPSATPQTVTGTTAGTGTVSSMCCSGGPENSYWFLTCAAAAATQFHATTCGAAMYDTVIDQRSAQRATTSVCNDDVGTAFACGQRSALNTTLTTGTGLHTMLLDSCSGAGMYGVTYSAGACTAGNTWCGACVNTLANTAHCGGCNRQCAAGNNCIAGACVPAPANDNRATATVISLTAPSQALMADTRNATHDATGSCGCTTTAPDVWYRFTLTQREYVYADTIGAASDTALLLTNAAGDALTAAGVTFGQTCNDNAGLSGCATGNQSQVLARLDPGTYHLVLSGCARGAVSIRFQHLPTGNGTTTFLPATEGTAFVGVTAGTGQVTGGSCCSNGPENSYYWYTCPRSVEGTFTASTCGRATWDTSVEQRSAGRATVGVCADDTCGRRSNITSTVPAGPGLHALYVDGCVSPATMNMGNGAYSVFVTRP